MESLKNVLNIRVLIKKLRNLFFLELIDSKL